MASYVGRGSYPRPMSYPSYGMYAGGSMFAYGAAARMCHRVAYYESRTQGYWGNNPAAYYVQAMGAHAASIARPGGGGGGGGSAAAGKTQGAQAQKAPDTGSQNSTKATGSTDDGGGKTKETEAERKARMEKEAEQQKVKDAKKKLDSLKKNAPSKLQTTYGYSKAEAEAITEMVYDKVKDAGVDAPEQFATYINTVPKKKSEDPKNPISHAQWAMKYGQWVAGLKGADNPLRATSDSICKIEVMRGRKLRKDADYARVEANGIRKVGGVTYNRYRVVKKKGRLAERRIGAQSEIYHDPKSGKWGTIEDGAFVPFRYQPKKWDKSLGLLNFGSGRLVPIPIDGLSATDINAAIDNWVKEYGVKADASKGSTTSKSPAVARAHEVKGDLEKFFGTRNGSPAAKVEVVDGRNIKITALGKTAEERGRNADFLQRKILADPAGFKRIVGSLGEKSAVTINGAPVSDVHGSAAADNAVAILAKTAIAARGPIDVRRSGAADPDRKFVNLKADTKIIRDRVMGYLKKAGYEPGSKKWNNAKKMVITLRFGKAPDPAAIKAVEEELNKKIKAEGGTCTIDLTTATVDVGKLSAQKGDPKLTTMLKLAHWKPDGSGDAKATTQEERLLKGSSDGLPFTKEQALAIAYKALQKKAREMQADTKITDVQRKEWMDKAVAVVKEYKGDAEVARFKSQAKAAVTNDEPVKRTRRRRSRRSRRSARSRNRARRRTKNKGRGRGGKPPGIHGPTSSTDKADDGTRLASRGKWIPVASRRDGRVEWQRGNEKKVFPKGVDPNKKGFAEKGKNKNKKKGKPWKQAVYLGLQPNGKNLWLMPNGKKKELPQGMKPIAARVA